MKKYILAIISTLLLFGCNYNNSLVLNNYACKKCIIKVGESKELVESRLGPAIQIIRNQDNTYTAVYASAYNSSGSTKSFAVHPSRTNLNNGASIHNITPSIVHTNENNKLIVLYDNNLQVKHYHFTKEIH